MLTTINSSHADSAVSAIDAAIISLDQLGALATLLSAEEAAGEFSRLDIPSQISLFGLFARSISDVRANLVPLVCTSGQAASAKFGGISGGIS
jgi:hypothetical protein